MNKYRAVKTKIDGIMFDSKREAAVYGDLRLLERVGKIRDLKVHTRFALTALSEDIGKYEADFCFVDMERPGSPTRVIDVKGMDTALSKWKRRHVKAQYGIEVEIWK